MLDHDRKEPAPPADPEVRHPRRVDRLASGAAAECRLAGALRVAAGDLRRNRYPYRHGIPGFGLDAGRLDVYVQPLRRDAHRTWPAASSLDRQALLLAIFRPIMSVMQ